MSKAVMWSIRKPHTDNIKNGNKWDEIRKRIPKDLTSEIINYIYETKGNGGCGKVIGEFRVFNKTYIYAELNSNGSKHLYNTAFIMPALSDEDLFKYLYDGKQNDGWALRISDLVIYDKPKELGEFYAYNAELHKRFEDGENYCCYDGTNDSGEALTDCPANNIKNCYRCWEEWSGWCHKVTSPPQSWRYVEALEK